MSSVSHDDATGEHFETRQTGTTGDWKPDPSKSIPLPPNRQRLMDDVIALYSCQPTIERVKRYTPDCVYDDQFVYKMAGQWFGLPKLFNKSENVGYQVVKNDPELIQFYNEQTWTFRGIPKSTTINALVSLSLDPKTKDSEFPQIKYHKDQANEKDYSHKGIGFYFKKWQADHVSDWMDETPEVQMFKGDTGDHLHDDVKVYKDGMSKTQTDTK
ncbi:hypothetical protein ONZ45_g18165 [Pleurotus djamor]|nr:hypothetical protein ONZ45_g18165 [Pleurotus djamor]